MLYSPGELYTMNTLPPSKPLEKDDLRHRAMRGGTATIFAQGAKLALNAISIVVLARLLAPEDFGLFAMVVAVTGFLEIFRSLGLIESIVKEPSLDEAQLSALWMVSAAMGLALAALTLALAPLLAWLYNDPRVLAVTAVLALTFVIAGVSIQHNALLRREMRFRAVLAVEVLFIATSVCVSIVSALLGFGYWSLVIGALAGETASTIALWAAHPWRPRRPADFSSTGPMLRFGLHIQAANVLAVIPINLGNILIGHNWGGAALGFYSRAFNLIFLPLNQLVASTNLLAVPTLSRLRDDPNRFRAYYLKALSLVTHFSMPTSMFLVVMSEEIIALVLGSKWQSATPIFRILSIVSFAIPVGESHKWVNVALGRGDKMLRISTFISVSFVSALFIGLPWGPTGVATSITASYWLVLLPVLAYAFHGSPVDYRSVLKALLRPLLVSVCVGLALVVYKVNFVGASDAAWVTLLLAAVFTVSTAAFAASAMAGEVNPIRYVRASIRALKV